MKPLDWLRRAPPGGSPQPPPPPPPPPGGPGPPGVPATAEEADSGHWGGLSRNDWVQLLEQAADLNDELCRENCELNREVSMLRQRIRGKRTRGSPEAENQARRVVNLLPRVMSHVRDTLQPLKQTSDAQTGNLRAALEESVRTVVEQVVDARQAESCLASSEETASLVSEKVALKQLSLQQEARIEELMLIRQRLSAATPTGETWASRITSKFRSDGQPQDGQFAGQQPLNSAVPPPPPPAPPVAPVLNLGDVCEVVGRNGVILRKSEVLQSDKILTIPPGGRVRILEFSETQARRARVVAVAAQPTEAEPGGENAEPPSGWLSVTTADGIPLIRPIISDEGLQDGATEPTAERSAGDDLASAGELATAETVLQSLEESVSAPVPAANPSQQAVTLGSSPTISQGTVTVSTDAWLALRNERTQREQQIKAFESQIELTKRELEQLATVRAELSHRRSCLFEARLRGKEFYETARMASEETATICRDIWKDSTNAASQPGANAEIAVDRTNTAACNVEEVRAENSTESSPEPSSEEAQRLVEWRRLMSERETTAQELARLFQKTEELEAALEERRIEMQVAERRRERERRSLMTAIRTLGSGSQSVVQVGGCGDIDDTSSNSKPCVGGADLGQDDKRLHEAAAIAAACRAASRAATFKEQHHLQEIAELEDLVSMLRAELEELQVRETTLNRNAVVRAGALRYASSAVGSLTDDEVTAPRSGRGDMEGLYHMLEGLFVENFSLSGSSTCSGNKRESGIAKGICSSTASGSDASFVAEEVACGNAEVPSEESHGASVFRAVDLNRFILAEDVASDDEDDVCSRGDENIGGDVGTLSHAATEGADADVAIGFKEGFVDSDTDALPAWRSEMLANDSGTASAGPGETPRSRLLRSLDFTSVPVKE